MSTSGSYNFSFKKGFDLLLNWKDSSGVVVNLTGFTAQMTLRNKPMAPQRFSVDLTSLAGKIILGGTPHNIAISALPSDTVFAPAARSELRSHCCARCIACHHRPVDSRR